MRQHVADMHCKRSYQSVVPIGSVLETFRFFFARRPAGVILPASARSKQVGTDEAL